MISWVVFTLSCRQTNLCLWMSQPWPWVKVIQRSSSTFSQTHTFFVPNIKGLAQTVLAWEAKVIAAAAAADADAAAETNWKHKVTPGWGDLIIAWSILIKHVLVSKALQINHWEYRNETKCTNFIQSNFDNPVIVCFFDYTQFPWPHSYKWKAFKLLIKVTTFCSRVIRAGSYVSKPTSF